MRVCVILLSASLFAACSGQSTESNLWNKLIAAIDDFPFKPQAYTHQGTVLYSSPMVVCTTSYGIDSNVIYSEYNVMICDNNVYAVMSSCGTYPVYEIVADQGVGMTDPYYTGLLAVSTGCTCSNFNYPTGSVYIAAVSAPGMPELISRTVPEGPFTGPSMTTQTSNFFTASCVGIPPTASVMVTFNASINFTNGINGPLLAPVSNFSDWTVMVVVSVFRSAASDYEGIYAGVAIVPKLHPNNVVAAFNFIAPLDTVNAETPVEISSVLDNSGKLHSAKIYITDITLAPVNINATNQPPTTTSTPATTATTTEDGDEDGKGAFPTGSPSRNPEVF